MRNPYHHEYPPADWTASGLAEAYAGQGTDPLPPRSDRESWAAVRSDPATGALADRIIEDAIRTSGDPLPTIPASLARAYQRGDPDARKKFLTAYYGHLERLTEFTLAECLEAEGRFLDDVLDHAWALCERTSWVNPGNLWRGSADESYPDGLPRPDPPADVITIELLTARTGFQLAEVDFLLGDTLPEGVRERIHREVERRIVSPYETRADFWWLDPPTNNWNGVCNACSLGAALYVVDDPERLARLTVKAVNSLRHLLAGFDPDGGTAEGINYWSYGFGYFTTVASLIEARTGGEYSLYDVPVVREIATFPLDFELSPGRFPAFSDASERADLAPYLLAWAGRRLDIPWLAARGRDELAGEPAMWVVGTLAETVRNLVWCAGVPDAAPSTPPNRVWYDGMEWWLARVDPADPDGLVLTAKGGDNAESHNHNDCGSFVVHHRGESLLTDLGAPVYEAAYWDNETRYDFLMARSLGHSVPLVDGAEQSPMPDEIDEETNKYKREVEEPDPADLRAAQVLEQRGDDGSEVLALDLEDCYPVATDLDSLTRRFTLDRTGTGSVSVVDAATFEGSGTLESVLLSYAPMDTRDGDLLVRGEHGELRIDTGGLAVGIEHLEDAVRAKTTWNMFVRPEMRDVWRARIGPVTGRTPEIGLSIAPTTE